MREVGTILNLKDGVAIVGGLTQVAYGELVVSKGNIGIVLHLTMSKIAVAFFSEKFLRTNDPVFRQKMLPFVRLIQNMFGGVLDPLGFLDSYLKLSRGTYLLVQLIIAPKLPVEIKAPGIIVRQSVYESLPTGIRIIDGLIPVGLGQRELIIGDRKTGKTAIVLDMILNQLRVTNYN